MLRRQYVADVICCCGVQTGLCRHTYHSAHLHGLAGFFTQGQLIKLHECLPEGCIEYVEEDIKVILPCCWCCKLAGMSNSVSSHVVRKCQEHACNLIGRPMQLVIYVMIDIMCVACSSAWCMVHCALCIVHCALCIVHCALCIVHCALCIVHCALCIVHCALCSVLCALCSVHCAVPIHDLIWTASGFAYTCCL